MLIASFAGAGLAALVAAGTALAATAPEANVPNPLLAPWSGPYGGVPPFDKVKVEQFKPALETAMTEALAEIDKVANDPAPPTFENTIVGLERSGRALDRVSNIFGIYSSTMSTPDFQKVEEEMAPKLAAFSDQITQNEKLFKRIAAVYDARERSGLTAEQKRLAWLDYTNFVRAGARLDAAGKKRIAEINQRLASLYTKFSQNLLADEADYVLFLDKEQDLAGLPDSLRSAAAAAAEQRGQKGKWAILNTRSSMEPFLTYSDRRDLEDVLQSRRPRRRARQQGDHHRDPETAGRARQAARVPDPRALASREHHGPDARAGDAAHGGGLETGGGARP